MPTSTVVTLMRQFKTDIARAGSAQQAEMARRWLAVERRLQGNIDALALEMTAKRAAGLPVTTNTLLNEVRYRELLIQLHEEQAKYTVYAERTITDGQEQLAAAGIDHSAQAIAAQVSTSFNRLPVSAVEHMVGLTAAGTPLNSLLVQSWPLSAQGLTQALVDGVALGWGPRKTAKMMAEGMTGSLDRMLTIARTEQLRTYRESSLATYKESGIVTGYRRLCAHDRRTCAACIMDEGHVYDLDEEMPEHPNGRCATIPVVKGAPPTEWLKGEEWFEQQDAAVQQDILGKGHYEGWKNGQFALQDVVKVTPNSTWGPSLGVTPLKELAGQAGRVALPPVALQPTPPPYNLSDGTRVRNAFVESVKNVGQERQLTLGLIDQHTDTIEALIAQQQAEMANAPGGWSDEVYERYKALTKPLQEKRNLLYEKIDDLEGQPHEFLAKAAAVDRKDAIKIDPQFQAKFFGGFDKNKDVKRHVNEAGQWLEGFVANDGKKLTFFVEENTTGRAYALPGVISIDRNEGFGVIAHEIGHNIEYARGAEARAMRMAFYDKRTLGDPVEKLIDVHPGVGYRPDEIFKRDAWMDDYMGRIYERDSDDRASSEIITMGIQYLYQKPVEFAEKDPEYFDFIIGYLRGTL